jgi:hypothetical protein
VNCELIPGFRGFRRHQSALGEKEKVKESLARASELDRLGIEPVQRYPWLHDDYRALSARYGYGD